MTTLAPGEIAMMEMTPIWEALLAVEAFTEQMTRFVLQELPADVKWDAAGMTAANRLCGEFRNEIWPHYVPDKQELVVADRAGKLAEKIIELNERFRKEVSHARQ